MGSGLLLKQGFYSLACLVNICLSSAWEVIFLIHVSIPQFPVHETQHRARPTLLERPNLDEHELQDSFCTLPLFQRYQPTVFPHTHKKIP